MQGKRFYVRLSRALQSIAVVLIVSLSLIPSAVAASTPDSTVLKWAVIGTPGSFADRNDIRSPSEINGLAAHPDGKTLYAIDIPNASSGPVVIPGVWKSTDSGVNWSPRVTQHLVAAVPAPTFPVMDIAVAPDDANLVAVVCLNAAGTLRREVYLSTDGGATWSYSGAIPWVHGGGEQIGDVTISQGYDLAGERVHDVVVCSRNPADGSAQGEIYITSCPGFDGWRPQGFTLGDVVTIACSPNYTTDFSLVAMASTTQRSYICLGFRDVAANTSRWNSDVNWPVEMCIPEQSGGASSGEDRIITGDIQLPGDFIGTSRERRITFAAYDSNGKAKGNSRILDDIYRLDDTLVTRMNIPGSGGAFRISSIAYNGDSKEGMLIAGEVGAVASQAYSRVWVCNNPLESCPVWQAAVKSPTGGGNHGYGNVRLTCVLGGSTALCGTGSGNRDTPLKWANPNDAAWNSQSFDESAISITRDNGVSWNQIGLIDTRIDWLKSVACSDDESTLYLATVNDTGFDSIWRSQTQILGQTWERVMCTVGDSPILRLAPETKDGATVFWGNQGTDWVRRSIDNGQTWFDCFPGVVTQDMVAADGKTLLVLQADGKVRCGGYAQGWLWSRRVDCGLSAAHMIVIYGDCVLIGASSSSASVAAYSTDRGNSWISLNEQTPSNGNRHVAFDNYFNRNSIIYLADDSGGIYRWTLGTSYNWEDLTPPNHSFYGMVVGSGGALYGVFSAASSGVDRALYPRSGIPKPGIYWDSLTTGLSADVRFTTEPGDLAISRATLWAIDARGYNSPNRGCLWAFTDTLARSSPRLTEPAEGVTLTYDPVSGRNQEVDLKWEQLSLASAYEIEVARDKDFSLLVREAQPATNPYYFPDILTIPTYRIIPGILPEANTIYYWHVRVREAATGQLIRSHWSDEYSFAVGPGVPVAATHLGVQALKPVHCACGVRLPGVAFSWTRLKGVTEYRFVLAEDSALTRLLVDEVVPSTAFEYRGMLDYKKAYFWQVTPLRPYIGEPSPVFSFTTEELPRAVQPAPQISDQLLQILMAVFLLNILGNVTMITLLILLHRRRSFN